MADSFPGISDFHFFAVNVYGSGRNGTQPKDAFHQFRPLGAYQSAYSQYFPFSQCKTDIGKRMGLGRCEMRHFQIYVPHGVPWAGKAVCHLPSHHFTDNAVHIQFLRGPGPYEPAIPQHCNLVCNIQHFFYLMGNINDRNSLSGQLPDNTK